MADTIMEGNSSVDSDGFMIPQLSLFTQEQPPSGESDDGPSHAGGTQGSSPTAAHKGTFDVFTPPGQADMDDDDVDSIAEEKKCDDGPVLAGLEELSSQSIGGGDDDSSSSDSDVGPMTGAEYMERVAKNITRNRLRLEGLGLAKPNDPTQREASDSDDESTDSEASDQRGGIVFSTPYNNGSCQLDAKAESSPRSGKEDISQLYQRYPFRNTQIRLLSSMVGATMAQAASNASVDSNDVYVPAPIFVTGPSGTGKTAVVLDALALMKGRYKAMLRASGGVKPVIDSAYVNCATIDPSSIEAIVESAFRQLTKGLKLHNSRRKKKTKKNKKWEQEKVQSAAVGGRIAKRRRHSERREMPVDGDEARRIDSMEAELDEEDEAAMAAMEERIEQTRTQLRHASPPETTKVQSSKRRSFPRKAKSAAHDSATAHFSVHRSRDSSVQRKKQGSGNSSRATVDFGKCLRPLFGADAYHSMGSHHPGSAFLVLDHAERLLSLGSKKSSENNNFLAQLLLLPKVYGLNLTVIVITSSALLDSSRINNDVSVEKALGIISIAVRPIRVHFPSYSGKDVFKAILEKPNVLSLIVGDSYMPSQMSGRQLAAKQGIVGSFLDTLVQSLVGVTRDLREMVRLGRQLWPLYIAPLSPERVTSTMRVIRQRMVKTSEMQMDTPPSHEILQKEMRAYLDEKILPRIKSWIDDNLFALSSDSRARHEASKSHGLSYLSKCLLLAAFICQHNKPDKDKQLFTNQKSGRRKSKGSHRLGSQQESAAYGGSSTLQQQQLKMIRPRLFPMERMLSVFVNIVGLQQKEDLLRDGVQMTDYVRSMGSTVFFQNLAQLRESGLLHESVGAALKARGDVNMTGTKFWCSLNRDEADDLASSVGLPLSEYLL